MITLGNNAGRAHVVQQCVRSNEPSSAVLWHGLLWVCVFFYFFNEIRIFGTLRNVRVNDLKSDNELNLLWVRFHNKLCTKRKYHQGSSLFVQELQSLFETTSCMNETIPGTIQILSDSTSFVDIFLMIMKRKSAPFIISLGWRIDLPDAVYVCFY